MRRHPPEVETFIRSNCIEHTARQMAAISEEALGFRMTAEQIHAYMSNHKIRGPRTGKKLPEKRITTPEMDDFIRQHCHGTGPAAMAALVNETFGTSFTPEQMKAYYGRNKLNSGLDGRFKPGQTPANKGKTWAEYMTPEAQERSRATTFKPGHTPHNGGTPVGTIRIRHDHKDRGGRPYAWQKVAEPNVWRMKHLVEWEEHRGPVPEGYIVTFANGDTLNWHIDNLILETRPQHAVKNRWGIHGYDMESAQAANTIADIKLASGKLKKRRRGKGARPMGSKK